MMNPNILIVERISSLIEVEPPHRIENMEGKKLSDLLIPLGYKINTFKFQSSYEEVSYNTKASDALIQTIVEENPDLVLLDLQRPSATDLKLCANIKNSFYRGDFAEFMVHQPILIVLTSSTDHLDYAQLIKAGADDIQSKPINRHLLSTRFKALLKAKYLRNKSEQTLLAIFSASRAVAAKEGYSEWSFDEVARLSVQIAKAWGFEEDELTNIYTGTMLRDVGKLGVDDELLCKKDKLTPVEFEHIQNHTLIGESLCQSLPSAKRILHIIRSHHERLDGSGYPDALSGSAIDISTRIVSIADIWTALNSDRPFRKALLPSEALSIIEKEVENGWWDGEVFETLYDIVEEG